MTISSLRFGAVHIDEIKPKAQLKVNKNSEYSNKHNKNVIFTVLESPKLDSEQKSGTVYLQGEGPGSYDGPCTSEFDVIEDGMVNKFDLVG